MWVFACARSDVDGPAGIYIHTRTSAYVHRRACIYMYDFREREFRIAKAYPKRGIEEEGPTGLRPVGADKNE